MQAASASLFSLNLSRIKTSLSSEVYAQLDWVYIEKLRELIEDTEVAERSQLEFDLWAASESKYLVLPDLIPRSQKIADDYLRMYNKYENLTDFSQYINDDENDPHLLKVLCRMRQQLQQISYDADHSISAIASPYYLIVLSAGLGPGLRKAIEIYQPKSIIVAVQHWEQLIASFATIDWELFTQELNNKGINLTLARVKDASEIHSMLAKENLPGIDHSVVYADYTDLCFRVNEIQDLAKKLASREDLAMIVNYLGFTLDEYNMVWNAFKSLSYASHLYSKPSTKIGGKFVVCGSGPSLDDSIPTLQKLADDHLIVASGSNIGTLLKNGIRVDFLVVLERGMFYYDDYKVLRDSYDLSNIRLVISSVGCYQLHELFSQSAVYFRPALTPISIFSRSPKEALLYESPQSVNTGVALALSLQADSIILVGVDLGSADQRDRSSAAVGTMSRSFTIPHRGNLRDQVMTNQNMLDAKFCLIQALENLGRHTHAYNLSNGIYIDGFLPVLSIKDYDDKRSDELVSLEESKAKLDDWWNSLPSYKNDYTFSLWSSVRPRESAQALLSEVTRVLLAENNWSTDVMPAISKLMDLHVPRHQQFARRIVRGNILKAAIAANRQILIMRDDPKACLFEKKARIEITQLADRLKKEIFMLCDAVES